MEIKNRTQLHFGAQYISPARIKQKRFLLPLYKDKPVNFVKLGNCEEDIESLNKFSSIASYYCFSYKMARYLRQMQDYQVYALTRQQDNFQKLDANQIVGVIGGTLSNTEGLGSKFFISHIEARSKNNDAVQPIHETVKFLGREIKSEVKYKGIGTELLKNVLTQLLTHHNDLAYMELNSLTSAKPFYRFLGWEESYMATGNYTPYRLTRRHFDDFLSGDSIYNHK